VADAIAAFRGRAAFASLVTPVRTPVKYSLNEVKGNTKGYGEAHPERDSWSCYLAKVHTAKLARTIKIKESLNDFIISRQRRLENTEK
jgi:hypothetical protein